MLGMELTNFKTKYLRIKSTFIYMYIYIYIYPPDKVFYKNYFGMMFELKLI